MATTIVTKNGSGAPTASDLVAGELAVDLTNKRLYTEDSGGTVLELGTNPASDVTFGDNTKAIFGAGSDLQIYHDGSHSYISDQGTGDLRILAADFRIRNAADNETMIQANSDADVSLWYNNSKKLATTNTGIDVTGTVTADGLTASGSGAVGSFDRTDANAIIELKRSGSLQGYIGASTSGDIILYNASAAQKFRAADNGDISFYEDTGTTAKFFWDASAESLGIGTDSPAQPIEILKTSAAAVVPMIQLRNGSSSAGSGTSIKFMHSTVSNATSGTCELESIRYSGNLGALTFKTSNNGGTVTERMRIDDTGVGIGTSSPRSILDLDGGSETQLRLQTTNSGSTTGDGLLISLDSSANAKSYIWNYENAEMIFGTNNTERMRIDSSGNLLVGKTSTTFSAVGVENRADGRITSTRSGNTNLLLNRLSSDGDIVQFYKDGTQVGSIGSLSGIVTEIVLDPRTNGASLTGGTNKISPGNQSGALDAHLDLGSSGNRFKDLHLSGNVTQGTTPSSSAAGAFTEAVGRTTYSSGSGTGGFSNLKFINGNGTVGTVTTSGSATAYNTSSDYRLKENVVAMSGATERLKQLKPSRFNFIADADTTVDGFLAHEVQDIVPEAISGTKDAVDADGNPEYQGIDQSKLVPLLVATIQELEARIAALES